ncbi:tRNA modification GTPase GTPBP3, mitochondrial [Leptopilina boulardi]|uniref:tRNA modification GTPase GTPBP3, mitochondrial n=1 Tax=Leptopilina boulardi TaxID=63433 RepID=UPI0021F5FD2C|nr:tRNA modification GTPase GTPBP3, mitochondrial [Leptopilina boulardi]
MTLFHTTLKSNSLLRSCLSSKHLRQWKFFGGSLTINSEQGSSTIYALSSGQGKCGVAVVRVSGFEALKALQKMTNLSNPKSKTTFLRKIHDPETGEIIDKGLCLWFPGPKSFTGEDTVEFQVHGGSAILSSLMTALAKLGFRPAEPGEFTRRSFYNNKLDLTEIEGLADLIHAETEQQRKQALLQASGVHRELYENWRHTLMKNIAHLEAYIDFSEEENIESDVLVNCNDNLRELVEKLENYLTDGRRGEILRSGVKTVILGKPNVGKSSLLNSLVRRDAAIVTSVAGTTRDIVELTSNISGYPVLLADTAGLANNSKDFIEQEGIRRARVYAINADFIILVVDAVEFVKSQKSIVNYIHDYMKNLELNDLINNEREVKNYIIVMNKLDLIDSKMKNFFLKTLHENNIIGISCVKKEGFSNLLDAMTKCFVKICGNPSRENPTISQTRHRIHLTNCLNCLKNYFKLMSNDNHDIVIATEEIRQAMKELGKVTGHVSNEQILDIIFKDFCIGK